MTNPPVTLRDKIIKYIYNKKGGNAKTIQKGIRYPPSLHAIRMELNNLKRNGIIDNFKHGMTAYYYPCICKRCWKNEVNRRRI